MTDSLTLRDQVIEKEYLEGMSLPKLGKRHGGISHERVRQILEARGVKLRSPGPVARSPKLHVRKPTDLERLVGQVKVIPDPLKGEHWVWPHKIQKGRYGKFVVGGRVLYAHRAAYLILKERLPTGRLRKICKIHNCIHPSHWRERAK